MDFKFSARQNVFALFLLVIVIWGLNWPLMKFGLAYISPFWFAAFRILSGAACLFLLLWLRNQLALPRRQDIPVLMTVGFLQIGCGMTFMHIALTRVDAGQSAILAYTTPLWTAPLAAMFIGERLTVGKLIGLGCGAAGILCLLNPLADRGGMQSTLVPNLLLISAAILWAVTIVHVRAHHWERSPLQLMPFQMLIGGLLIIPFAYVFDGPPAPDWSATLVAVLLYNGPLASAFCFWGYVSVARYLQATTTAIGSLGIPVVGLLSSAWFLNEELSANKISGLLLICLGILIVTVGTNLKVGAMRKVMTTLKKIGSGRSSPV